MKRSQGLVRLVVVAGCAGLVFGGCAVADSGQPNLAPVVPQTAGFSSKPVLAAPISGDAAKEVVVIDVNIAPGAASPTHTHPGDCYGFVAEGTIELTADGKEPRKLETGQAFTNAQGTVHGFRNAGSTPVKLVNFLVVEKGKPRTVPVGK